MRNLHEIFSRFNLNESRQFNFKSIFDRFIAKDAFFEDIEKRANYFNGEKERDSNQCM